MATVAHDRYDAIKAKLRATFDAACPDLPVCRARVDKVFRELGSYAEVESDGDLWKICELAYDLGLEIEFRLVEKAKP